MNIQPINYKTKGVYYSHSAVTQLNLSYENLVSCYERFATRVESKHQSYYGFTISKQPLDKLDDIMPMLVSKHERNHYTQLMSTPCGILNWRIINGLTSAVSFLLNHLKGSPAKFTCYLPLTAWYSSIGQKAIHDNPPSPPKYLINKRDIDINRYTEFIQSYINYVFNEIAVLNEFVFALEGQHQMSMAQFVDLANLAFEFLAERSELPVSVKWTAHNLNLPSYLPMNAVSQSEMLEATARFEELEILKALGASNTILDEWQNRSIFGIYKPAYDYLLLELSDPFLARVAIDIALMTPIDLACSKAVSGQIYVEDVLPSWRLPKIVAAIKDSFWTTDRTEQEMEARKNIAARANIPTPEQSIQAILSSPLTGTTAWSGDAIVHESPDELTNVEYFLYMDDEMKRAMQIREADSLALIRPAVPDVFQPVVEFFEDRALFHLSPVAKKSDSIHFKAYRTIIYNLAALALVSDGDISDALRLQSSFANRIALEGDVSKLHDVMDARNLLKETIDPVFFELLRW